MRRHLSILIILIAVLFCLNSAESDSSSTEVGIDHSVTQFEILGYKIDSSEELAIVITDALSESLNIIGETYGDSVYDEINLDNHLADMLGNVSSGSDTDNRNRIAFSYRVNGRGNSDRTETAYQVKFTFHPFYLDAAGTEQNASINASYQLTNLSYSFPDYTSDKAGDFTIQKDARTSESRVVVSANSVGELSSYWKVSGGYNSPEWIHRGAIAVTIDDSEAAGGYNNNDIPFGYYKANVVVNLVSLQ